MKHLLFAIIFVLSLSYWSNSSDAQVKSNEKLCSVTLLSDLHLKEWSFDKFIKSFDGCRKNDVVTVWMDKNFQNASSLAAWICRFDREIVVSEFSPRDMHTFNLSCVYSGFRK